MPLFLDSDRSGSRAELNAGICITIGLINNMPDAALEATERQFTDLIRAATPNAVVLLRLFTLPEMARGEAARNALAGRYRDVAALWDTPLDGLIVTGAEPRAKNLMDEPYWDTLSRLVDWAKDHTASTIWSCLAAHAAVLHCDGIERRALKQKLFGVFDCRLVADHPMTEHFPEPLWVPHSRYNDLPEDALAAAIRSSPGRMPPVSMLSPSRTAASFCSSRAIPNTRRIRSCANIAAMSRAFWPASARTIRKCHSSISMTMRQPRARLSKRGRCATGAAS